MNSELRTTLRMGLVVGGVVGLILSLATLPTVWGVVIGQAKSAYIYGAHLPRWAQWHYLSLWGVLTMVAGAQAALLLITGRWPARGIALSMIVVFIYSRIALASTGYWGAWMANAGDGTPLTVSVTVSGVLLIASSIAALILAARLRDG